MPNDGIRIFSEEKDGVRYNSFYLNKHFVL